MKGWLSGWDSRIFLYGVRRLRWLARVPAAPQIFDAILLAWVSVANRPRLAAMETLEAEALSLPGMRLRVHRFGGTEFVGFPVRGELGHVHGHGLLDVRLSPGRARQLISGGAVRSHHVLPKSGWVSFQLETIADVPFALDLIREARALREGECRGGAGSEKGAG